MGVKLEQSAKMTGRINLVVVGLLAWLAIVNSTPTPFPDGRTLIYDYYGDVKAGIIEPAAYASQYAIAGKLNIRHDTSDVNLKRAYYFAFTDVKTGLHNGLAQHFQKTNVNTSIPEAAKAILKPFLVVYNDLGQLKGVKLAEDDPGWSRNMKMATASMLQLDLASVQLDKAFRPQSYMVQEKTVHGDCWTSYDIHSRDPEDASAISLLTVYKFSSPRNCSNYRVHSFNPVDAESCDLSPEAPMNMAARRAFQVENQGKNLLITSLVAHGGANYFPWNGRSEAHYILNNASFVLEKNVESSEVDLPQVDFQNVELTRDLSYIKRLIRYNWDATVDVSQGRHEVNQNTLGPRVKQLLEEASDYLDENHLDLEKPDIKRGEVMNEILHEMSFMNSKALYDLYEDIKGMETQNKNVVKSLFLDMLGHVGTLASTLFAVDLAMDPVSGHLNVLQAVSLLANVPLSIRQPSIAVLGQMRDHLLAANPSKPIHKASILMMASLVNRVFKDDPKAAENTTVINYLTELMDFLKTDPSYEMKVVYLMAMKNVQVGDIHKYLAPLIRGDIELSDRPAEIRLMAILAVQKAVANDYNVAHDLLWPVMADYRAPLKIRIAAYDILIRQAPTMTNILHIYWFMVYEKNEHLYNYHYMTIQGLANSVDPCQYHLRELTTKIMRFTRIHSPVPYKLSTSHMLDMMDDVYGHGEKFGISIVRSEHTGLPELVHLEHGIIEGRKPVNNFELYVNMKGFEKEFLMVLSGFVAEADEVSNETVLKMLKDAAHHVPLTEDSFLDLVQIKHGKVVNVVHLDGLLLSHILRSLSSASELARIFIFNHRDISKVSMTYDYLFEKHIVSEMGLPVVLQNRVPLVHSLKFKISDMDVASGSATLQLSAKLWRHGDYSMSIYNPMMDVWHTIKRTTSLDAVLPLQVKITLRPGHGLQLHIPRLPLTEFSTMGVKSHARDLTVITQDANNTLLSACPTCSHHEVVSNGPAAVKTYQKSTDLKDTGLNYSLGIFDCESGVDPLYLHKQHVRLMMERQNSWNDVLAHVYLASRLHFKTRLISPEMGSCGILMKIAPSTIHPTSHLDVNLRLSIEEFTNSSIVRPLDRQKIAIRGSIDAISSETNTSNRKWDLNLNIDLSPDHVENGFNAYFTRITPGEENLKICIDGSKTYPALPLDILKLGLTREQTHSKLSVAVAHTNKDECLRDQMLVVITTTGMLSDEQRESFIDDSIKDSCSRDMKNPLLKGSTNLVPKTVGCYDRAIKHTSLRKYEIEVTHKNVPKEMVAQVLAIGDAVRAVVLPHVVYTRNFTTPGTVNIDLEYPLKMDTVNVSVMTPDRSYDLVDVDLSADNFPPRHAGFGPDVEKHLWILGLDNTRFSTEFLLDYTTGDIKLCSLYRKIALTFDGGEFPFEIPRNWSMMTGIPNTYATFIKSVDEKLALRMYLSSHIVEILPVNDKIQVTIDNEALENVMEGGDAYRSEWLKLSNHGQNIVLLTENPSTFMIYTVDSVTVMMSNNLQGMVAGLCGHMDGRHLKHVPHAIILNDD